MLRKPPALYSCATLITAISGVLPHSAIAKDISFLEEVVVTAQKRSQSEQDIGMAISAYTDDQLSALGFSGTNDVADLVPGLTYAKSFQGTPILTLRGIGFNTPNLASTSPVGVYYDEVSYAYPAMTQGLNFDVERIEVLKGPQGTLYGRNTTGGLINHIAKKPSQESETSIQFSVGNYDSYGVEGIVNGALSSSLSARLAVKTEQSDEGWQKSVTHGESLGEVDRSGARLSLLFAASEDLDILFTGSWWEDRSDTQAGQSIDVVPEAIADLDPASWPAALTALGIPTEILTQADHRYNSNEDANWVVENLPWGGTVGGQNFTQPSLDLANDSSMTSLALHVNWTLSDSLELTSITSYSDFERDNPTDPAGWDIENAKGRLVGTIESFAQELRLSGETGKANWIGGLFYSSDELEDNNLNWGATITSLGPLRTLGSQGAAAAGAPLSVVEDIQWGFRD